MEIFFHPELDPLGKGFHITQSLIAVGTGGISGLGLMEGRQKLYFLPEAWTDFIFANISEELGLLGALALVALFCVLGYRGLRAAFLSTDPLRAFWPLGSPLRCSSRPSSISASPLLWFPQGDHAAVHLLRRNVALLHPGRNGCAVEYYA